MKILPRPNRQTNLGQAALEYALVLAIVGTALLAMGTYTHRAVQGGLYKIEHRITGQVNGSAVTTYGCGGPGQNACA